MRKFLLAILISLAFLVPPIDKPGIVYSCTGTEMFPTYFGSPFVYKSTSLATSMAFDYYFIGLLANVIVWSAFLLLIRFLIYRFVLNRKNKRLWLSYTILKYITAFLCVCILAFMMQFTNDNTLRLHVNLNEEAKTWGMTCGGQLDWVE